MEVIKTRVLKEPEVDESGLYCKCFIGDYDATCCHCSACHDNTDTFHGCGSGDIYLEKPTIPISCAPVKGDILLTGASPIMQLA